MDIKQGSGFGYIDDKNIICMIRCFDCGKENYVFTVSEGYCAWCGYNPTVEAKQGLIKDLITGDVNENTNERPVRKRAKAVPRVRRS